MDASDPPAHSATPSGAPRRSEDEDGATLEERSGSAREPLSRKGVNPAAMTVLASRRKSFRRSGTLVKPKR
jgi:hypothetical protein